MSSPARRPPRRVAPTRQRGPGSGTATPEGSATQTITSSLPSPHPDGLVLRLRGAHSPVSTAEQSASASDTENSHATGRRRRIQWAEDVVDNEGLGRKKSKVCCIFHKNREVGESSDEDDSSSSESDSGSDDDGGARMAGARKRGRRGRRNGKKKDERDHEHGEDCAHGHDDGQGRRPSPNAYERMPKYDVKPLEKQPGK